MALSNYNIKKKYNVIEYILAFFIIIDCNSVYSLSLSSAMFTLLLGGFLSGLLFLFNILIQKQNNISNIKEEQFFIFFMLFFLFVFIIYSYASTQVSVLFRFGTIVPLIIMYFITKNSQQAKFSLFLKMSNIIYYLALISLVLWISVSILHILPFNTTLVADWAGRKPYKGFMYLYFESQDISASFLPGMFVRNTGIFVEGPMYCFIIAFGLTVELFFKHKINRTHVVVLICTLLSVFSTTGFLYLLVLFLFKVFFIKPVNKFYNIVKLVSIPFLLYLGVLLVGIILKEKKSSGGSLDNRAEMVSNNIDAWKRSPLIGNGYGFNSKGNSNAIFTILSDGGILEIAFYLIPLLFIPFLFSLKSRDARYVLATVLFFIVFCVTIVQYNLIVLVYLAFWYSTLLSKKNNFTLL